MTREELCVKALEGISDDDLIRCALFADQYERLAMVRQLIGGWMDRQYRKARADRDHQSSEVYK